MSRNTLQITTIQSAFVATFFVLLSVPALPQSCDVSGTWQGTLFTASTQLQGTWELKQDHPLAFGTVGTASITGTQTRGGSETFPVMGRLDTPDDNGGFQSKWVVWFDVNNEGYSADLSDDCNHFTFTAMCFVLVGVSTQCGPFTVGPPTTIFGWTADRVTTGLTILTTSLPNGTLSQSYSQTLTASGGTPPYTWSIISGALPDGLTLNSSTGQISGTPTKAETFTFTVQVADSNGQTTVQSLTIQITGIATISSLKVTQGPTPVTDAISTPVLIQGRPTDIYVRGSVDPSVTQLTIALDNGVAPKTVSSAQFMSLTGVGFQFIPATTGVQSVTASASINGQIVSSKVLTVAVAGGRSIPLTYVDFDYLGATPSYLATESNGTDFLQGVLPIDTTLFPMPFDAGVFNYSPCHKYALFGRIGDAFCLGIAAKRMASHPERLVAIVPHAWFSNILTGPGPGVNFPLIRDVAFVQDEYPMTVAHELSHSYGLPHSTETPNGGDWVQKYPNGRFLAGGAVNYMEPGTPTGTGYRSSVPPLAWTTPEQFNDLLLVMAGAANDPELLVIAGLVAQDGSVSIADVGYAQNGFASQDATGSIAINLLDYSANIVQTRTFEPTFVTSENTPLPASPFLIAVPLVQNAVAVQVVGDNQVKAHFFIASELLSSIISGLPDIAFQNNATQRRAALLNQIAALDHMLSVGDQSGALLVLENAIRTQVQNWVSDTYVPASPLQYGRPEILAVIDRLAQSL